MSTNKKRSEQSQFHEIDFSTILAASVHDMKNSVGMLIASLEGVMDDMPPANEVQSRRFSTLHYEASRISGDLVQLLTLYRMQNSLLPVRIDEHYVLDIFDDQIARNDKLLESAGINMKVDCDDNLNWYFDLDLIGSVVHNILINCARYTKSALSIAAEVRDDMLRISINDDGPGFPTEMLEKSAGQLEEDEVRSGKTHLGLHFAQQIASAHKQNNRCGYIKLSNGGSLGGGLFEIFIP